LAALTLALLGLFSAAIGSFIGALVTRWPHIASLVHGRSHCDGCKRMLTASDLVPILSYLSLRGRCRACHNPIDPAHIVAEVLAVTAALWTALVVPINAAIFPITCLFGWLLMPLALIDWRHLVLPNVLVLLLFVAGLGVAWSHFPDRLLDHVIGAAAGYLGLAAIALFYRLVRGRDGMGWGDIKLLGAIGVWVSWEGLPGVLLIAALTGLLVATVQRCAFGSARQHYPLGTFLAIGAWIIWLYGPVTLA